MKNRPYSHPIVKTEGKKTLNTALAQQGDHQSGTEESLRGVRGGISHL